MVAADEAIAEAARLDPDDALTAFLRAQSAYELGHPAAALFARARALWPDNADALRNHALALASEGDPAGAEALLAEALRRTPDWLDGQRVLAGLRFSHGAAQGFDAGYAEAVRRLPGHAGLWLGWFGAVAQQRDWERAQAILADAAAALGETHGVASARAFLASETGALAEAERHLAALPAGDPFVGLCRIRTALRRGQPERAEAEAQALVTTPFAGQAWPYLSTCWRLTGDRRATWLDGDPPFVGVLEPAFSATELAELAALLRGLHTARRPYAEQTVRGGTQTDRSVLLRHEPLLIETRRRLMKAIEEFARTLPPARPGHPLLARRRDDLRIAGSWSVRLTGGGHNVAHSHPTGWLSAVFYVAVPDPVEPAPAGHLTLGAPPEDLGTGLAPFATIAPAPGRLVVFPSTLWHATVPFAAGERLNIAFDVVPA